MSRVAFLVLCAFGPKNLGRICSHFVDSRFAFFLHLDAKLDAKQYFAAAGPLQREAYLIPNRRAVFWGGFSMVEATAELMRTAVNAGMFEHFVLMSDDSFPLLPPDALHTKITSTSRSWIETWPVPPDHEFQDRYRQFFYLDSAFSNPRWVPTEKRAVTQDDLDSLARLELRRRIGKVPLPQLYAGKQWWVLKRHHVVQMLDYHDHNLDFQESFRFSAVTDEIYLQTMFRQIFFSEPVGGNPMYDDFTGFPKPLVFTKPEQLAPALKSGRLFVRKVGENAEAYVNAIVDSWG